MLKSHSCGELRKENVGQTVKLAGWVDRRRDHGGLIFIDLRDRDGVTQVVFNPEMSGTAHKTADQLRGEYVAGITGKVSMRPAGTENSKLATGDIEIVAESVAILNTSLTPPFYINEDIEVEENLRLKYRYLDLRRTRMKDNLLLRAKIVRFMRNFLESRGFIDVETPMLIKSTPEGARDYMVPSRVWPGCFYALPQSPQQMKQLLMVAGIEKYYQIARCFRDEDTRADRQPEFTQLDIEQSFVEEEDILQLVEALFTSLMETVKPEFRIMRPFPRITFAEAMEKYGSDKPDLRFGLEIKDLSDIVASSEFAVFRNTVAEGGKVKGLCAAKCGSYTRSQLDELNNFVQTCGAKGVVTISLGSGPGDIKDIVLSDVKSQALKYLTLEQVKQMAERLEATKGDLLLLIAGKGDAVSLAMGELRKEMGKRLNLADPNLFAFGFVVDFPLFEWNKDENHWQSMHHPFTEPKDGHAGMLEKTPETVHGKHYDLICNGFEIGGGSIRIHNTDLQRRVFHILGHTDESIDRLFGHIMEAFRYGAPPHGGVAFGVDRLVMLLAGENTIRQVIAFPKNQNAVDLVFNAPAEATETQLRDMHIRLREEDLPKAET
ncbi:MAG: aspartate--tRNA ligase [Dehalococcoidales bacterium]|nr:aspartate--tRNA ligase [Dehalococcoidales bacterium]